VSLIDYRLKMAGLKRPSGTTLNRWSLQPKLQPVRSALLRVAAIADEVRFGEHSSDRVCTNFDDGILNELKTLELSLNVKDVRPKTVVSPARSRTLAT